MATQRKKGNSQLKGDFRGILFHSRREFSPFGTTFVFEPENYEQQKLGTLFGIIKIDDTSKDSSYVVNLLASVIKKEYFSKTNRTPAESFEAALKKANSALAELARKGNVGWIDKINFVGGILERNNLHFTQVGHTFAFLIRNKQIVSIGGESTLDEVKEPHPLKTFIDISGGKLEKGDKLIFTTSDLLDIFSLEEIKQNAIYFSKEEFRDIIEGSLKVHTELSGVIILDFLELAETKITSPAREEKVITPQKRSASSASRVKPAADQAKSKTGAEMSEQATADIADRRPETPPLVEIPRQKTAKDHLYIKETDKGPPKISAKDKLTLFLRNTYSNSAVLLNRTKRKLISLGRKFRSAKRKKYPIKRGVPAHEKLKSPNSDAVKNHKLSRLTSWLLLIKTALPQKTKACFIRSTDTLKSLKLKNKRVLLPALIVFAILIIFALLLLNAKKSPPQDAVPARDVEIKTEPELTQEILNDVQTKKIENIETIFSFSQPTKDIAYLKDCLFTLGEKNSVWKINPETKEGQEVKSELDAGNFEQLCSMPNLGTIFILTDSGKIISHTPINDKFQENQIELPQNQSIADIKTYLTYLYVLTPKANQIYRYPRAEGGFGEGINWFRSPVDISETNNLAINDYILIAFENEIKAYSRGKLKESLKFETPNIPLKIERIYSSPNLNYIYALDRENKRIVQYSKEGKIVVQYINAEFSKVKNFAVDEKSKQIYLLTQREISKFSID